MISDAKFRKLLDKKSKLQDKLALKVARIDRLKAEQQDIEYEIDDLKNQIALIRERMQE